MLSVQNQEPSIIDALGTNLTEWYSAVDDGIRKSDIVPGTYDYTTHPSYGNVGQIQENADTNLDIQLNNYCIASLENSHITMEQYVTITPSSTTSLKNNILKSEFYIGYQYAAEAIYAYDVTSNSDRIQNITHANYEWFILRNSVQEDAKRRDPAYATLEKIRRKDPHVPGTYVDLSALEANKPFTVTLKLKIPLNSFLIFRQLRYILHSFGNLTLTITPSYKNIVVAPCYDPLSYEGRRSCKFNDDADVGEFESYYNDHSRELDFGFHNLNQPCNWIVKTVEANEGDGAHVITHEEVTFKCNNQITDKVEIHTAYYMLEMDVYNALSARYMQAPLLFPIQKIVSKDFTTNLATGGETIDTALTVQLKHADGMATVFKKGVHSHSCFENPQIRFQFSIDGKTYPRREYETVDDLRTINQTLDFLNFNNLSTTSIGDDIANSLQPYYTRHVYDSNGNEVKELTPRYHSADRSNFMIGIPFADNADFMGGISTRGTIQIQLKGNRIKNGGNEATVYSQPVAIFTEDALLKIRTMKPPGSPQISITEASIEQVIAAQGNA